jgi:hypothetical protein
MTPDVPCRLNITATMTNPADRFVLRRAAREVPDVNAPHSSASIRCSHPWARNCLLVFMCSRLVGHDDQADCPLDTSGRITYVSLGRITRRKDTWLPRITRAWGWSISKASSTMRVVIERCANCAGQRGCGVHFAATSTSSNMAAIKHRNIVRGTIVNRVDAILTI